MGAKQVAARSRRILADRLVIGTILAASFGGVLLDIVLGTRGAPVRPGLIVAWSLTMVVIYWLHHPSWGEQA